ncbi:MAG: hypothetical protein QM630_03990 [Microbacterium sp.]
MVIALAAVISLVACSPEDPIPSPSPSELAALSLEEALADYDIGDEFRVDTGLVADAEQVLLCDAWIDTVIPYCDPTLTAVLVGADLDQFELDAGDGRRFGGVDIVVRRTGDAEVEFVSIAR